MKNRHTIIMCITHIFLIVGITLLITGAFGHVTDHSFLDTVKYIKTMNVSINGGESSPVLLPHSFKNLKPRTSVVLTTNILHEKNESIYIKTIFSPAKIYANDELIYQFGVKDEYPSFMQDPGIEVHIIELEGLDKRIELKMEFLSPVSINKLVVSPPMVGTSKHVIFNTFHDMAIPLIFSFVQIFGGIALITISLCISFVDKKGISFFWLGLFSFLTGIWAFSENNFTSVVIKNPTVLYLLMFIGIFTFIIPLIEFTHSIIDFENPKPLWIIEFFFSIMIVIVIFLQLTGKVPFSKSMLLFHIIIPIALGFLTFYTIREYMLYKTTNAHRFILPAVIMTLSGFLQWMDYNMSLKGIFRFPFQLGTLFFLLIMGMIAALSIRDSIDFKNKEKELHFEKQLMDIQLKEQKERGLLLAHKEFLLRQQRHDLRHQLTAIRELTHEENVDLRDYLDTLIEQIPKSEQKFCENSIVNSVISHYHTICQSRGIELEMNLVVPSCENSISDSELCIIFGNLLENAVEACSRMTGGRRFIRLNSTFYHGLLTITMDNSFDGTVIKNGDHYRSSKRNDYGIGLESIRTVTEKAHGGCQFIQKENIFLSSVYLKI